MLVYLIFLISALYEDISGVYNHIKHGPDPRTDVFEVEGKENKFRLSFNGRLTEFIYLAGLVYGTFKGPYSLLFLLVLFMAQIPKKVLVWTIIDALVSSVVLVWIFFATYYEILWKVIDFTKELIYSMR